MRSCRLKKKFTQDGRTHTRVSEVIKILSFYGPPNDVSDVKVFLLVQKIECSNKNEHGSN